MFVFGAIWLCLDACVGSLDLNIMKSAQFSAIVGFVVESLACSWLGQHYAGACLECLVDMSELI